MDKPPFTPRISRDEGFGKKRFFLVAGLLPVVLGAIIWLAIPRNEPVYQGKRLSAWLYQSVANETIHYQNPPPNHQSEEASRARANADAETAIKHIGTNALPYLLKMAAVKDSPLKERLISLWYKQSLVSLPFRSAGDFHRMAIAGFASLRSDAAPAVPGLIKLLYISSTTREGDMAQDAGNCLSFIGPASVPGLLPLATNKNPAVEFFATGALDTIAPRLAYLLGTDENETNRRRYAFELAEIGSGDSHVTNALANALTDKSLLVRRAATNALIIFKKRYHARWSNP